MYVFVSCWLSYCGHQLHFPGSVNDAEIAHYSHILVSLFSARPLFLLKEGSPLLGLLWCWGQHRQIWKQMKLCPHPQTLSFWHLGTKKIGFSVFSGCIVNDVYYMPMISDSSPFLTILCLPMSLLFWRRRIFIWSHVTIIHSTMRSEIWLLHLTHPITFGQ